MEETREEQGKKYAKLIAKVWSDESFKQRLLSDPRVVLEAEGISVPPGVEVKVLETTQDTTYLVIPLMPADVKIHDIDQRYAASSCSTLCLCKSHIM